MKKTFIMLLAAGAMIVSCQPKAKTEAAETSTDSTIVADTTVYEGTIPAADGPGIRYTLSLANDSTGGFGLVETYLEAEDGKDQVHRYAGKVENVEKGEEGHKLAGLQLALNSEDTLYFVQPDDSTLRLVNKELQEATIGLNYDLKKK